MTTLRQERLQVNGTEVELLRAGSGRPLVYLHGPATFAGFDFVLDWATLSDVFVPVLPGFGGSADDPRIRSTQDVVMHVLEMVDLLGLEQFDLVGHSIGGWVAALFATQQRARVRRLVLAAPWGLGVSEHPTLDLFRLLPDEFLPTLTADMGIFAGKVPEGPSPEHNVARYRESIGLARVAWERVDDPALARWLHRLTMPTLLPWGGADRVTPPQQAAAWAELLPSAEVRMFEGRGHLLFEETVEARTAVREFLAVT